MERARKAIISRKQASQYPTEYGHKIRKGSWGRQEAFVPNTRHWFSTANTCEFRSKYNRQHTKCPFHHPHLPVIYLPPPNTPDFLQMFSLSQKENQFPTTNTLTFLPPMQIIRKLKDILMGSNQEKQHHGGKAETSRLNSSI